MEINNMKCKHKYEEYIYQPILPDGGYGGCRVMGKCKKCGVNGLIRTLPFIEGKVNKAEHKLR